MIDELTFAGAPARSLTHLFRAQSEAAQREPMWFHIASNFEEATHAALVASPVHVARFDSRIADRAPLYILTAVTQAAARVRDLRARLRLREPALDAVAAMPPMWLADAVRSASAPEDAVLQRRRLLKQRQRLHEKKAVAARERRERLAGRVLVLAPPRLGFAHEC